MAEILQNAEGSVESSNGKIRAQKIDSAADEHINHPVKFQMEKRAVFFQKRKIRSTMEECASICSGAVDVPNEWESQLEASSPNATSVQLTWSRDDIVMSSTYIVQFRQKNTRVYTTATPVPLTEVTYLLEGLSLNTFYEVRVCVANATGRTNDECGGCSVCVETAAAREPPSAPREVSVRATFSELLEIGWREPAIINEGGITNYQVNCTAVFNSLSMLSLDVQPTGNLIQTLIVRNLSPNTLYMCSVVAQNMFGSSDPSSINITTLEAENVAGALLLHYAGSLVYSRWTESGAVAPLQPLLNISDSIISIDYDYRDNEIYLSTDDGGTRTIKRLDVNTQEDANGLTGLTAVGDVVTVVNAESGVEFGDITVDWICHELFYVAVEGGINRILRRRLVPNVMLYCVAEMTERVIKMSVEPAYGFFYWSTGEILYRTDISIVQTSSTQCPTNLPAMSTRIITAFDISTFTIEQNVGIFFIGGFFCEETNENLTALQSTTLDGRKGSSSIWEGSLHCPVWPPLAAML